VRFGLSGSDSVAAEPRVIQLPIRNQRLIKSTFPVSYAYVSPSDKHAPRPDSFLAQFECELFSFFSLSVISFVIMTGNSTADFVPYLSVGAGDAFQTFLFFFFWAEIEGWC
jgi:hypothetical protein